MVLATAGVNDSHIQGFLMSVCSLQFVSRLLLFGVVFVVLVDVAVVVVVAVDVVVVVVVVASLVLAHDSFLVRELLYGL